MAKAKLEARFRFEENFMGTGDKYLVVENRHNKNDSWGLDKAFLVKGDMIPVAVLETLVWYSDMGCKVTIEL